MNNHNIKLLSDQLTLSKKIKYLNFLSLFSFFVTVIKGALSGLRQFLATESPLKMRYLGFCLGFLVM